MSGLSVEAVVADAPESARLWEALAARRLELQRCGSCARLRFPPLPACPYCATPGGEWEAVEPRGRLYSWVTTHVAFDPALADELPYTIATVDLDAGPRLFARLTDFEAAQLRDGLAVEGYFHAEQGLPFVRFRPADDS